MKVNILGFEIKMAQGVEVGDFYQQLELIEDKEINLKSRKTILYTDVIDNYICGLVLSYKSNKKSLVSARDIDGDLTVTKNVLKDDEHGTEVSLFVIHPHSLKGLFYSYSGSVSPTGFAELLKKRHDADLRFKKQSYKDELTQFNTKKVTNIGKKISEKYSGAFSLSLLATPSDLKKLLPRYGEIKQVILRATNALSEGGRYTPLEDITKRSSIIVDIEQGGLLKDVKSRILSVFGPYAKQQKETALRVIGLAHSGEELSLVVAENNDNFGRIDYDEYVDLLPRKKWKNYTKCIALLRLLEKVIETDVVFGDKPLDKKWKINSAKDINKGFEESSVEEPA